MNLVEQIKAKAKQSKQMVVLPEGYDERMVQAAAQIIAEGLADVTLLGNVDSLNAKAAELGVSLDGVTLLDPRTAPQLDDYVAELVKLRERRRRG